LKGLRIQEEGRGVWVNAGQNSPIGGLIGRGGDPFFYGSRPGTSGKRRVKVLSLKRKKKKGATIGKK